MRAPTSEYEPPAHEPHVEAAIPECLPASQSVQTSAPAPEYVPGAHELHEAALVSDHVPPSHLVHSLLPSSSEYLPLSHSTQTEARPLELVPAEQIEQLTAAPSL